MIAPGPEPGSSPSGGELKTEAGRFAFLQSMACRYKGDDVRGAHKALARLHVPEPDALAKGFVEDKELPMCEGRRHLRRRHCPVELEGAGPSLLLLAALSKSLPKDGSVDCPITDK